MSSGALAGMLSSVAELGSNALMARMNQAMTQRLMKQQQEYNLQNFSLQNARQDFLLQNSALMQKNNLMNAGYSTADPNGTGVSTPSVGDMSLPSASAPAISGLGDLSKYALLDAQIENIKANTKKTESETEGQDIDNFLNKKYGENKIQSAIRNMDEDTQKKVTEAMYNEQKRLNDSKLTDAQVMDISERLHMDWEKMPLQLQLLSADVYQAVQSGNMSKANASKAYAEIRKMDYEIFKIQEETELTRVQTILIGQLTDNAYEENKLLHAEAQSAEYKVAIDKLASETAQALGLDFYKTKAMISAWMPVVTTGVAAGAAAWKLAK